MSRPRDLRAELRVFIWQTSVGVVLGLALFALVIWLHHVGVLPA